MSRFVNQQSNIPNGLASALLCPGECEDRASNAWQLRLRHHSAAASEENNRLMMMTTAAARNGRTDGQDGLTDWQAALTYDERAGARRAGRGERGGGGYATLRRDGGRKGLPKCVLSRPLCPPHPQSFSHCSLSHLLWLCLWSLDWTRRLLPFPNKRINKTRPLTLS